MDFAPKPRPSYRVIIAGSRTFSNYRLMVEKCDAVLYNKFYTHDIIIVSGGAKGADQCGERYAQDRGLKVEVYPAEWDKYGSAAGPIRNKQMAAIADAVIVFWDGHSAGTRNMIELAQTKPLPYRVIKYEHNEKREIYKRVFDFAVGQAIAFANEGTEGAKKRLRKAVYNVFDTLNARDVYKRLQVTENLLLAFDREQNDNDSYFRLKRQRNKVKKVLVNAAKYRPSPTPSGKNP